MDQVHEAVTGELLVRLSWHEAFRYRPLRRNGAEKYDKTMNKLYYN